MGFCLMEIIAFEVWNYLLPKKAYQDLLKWENKSSLHKQKLHVARVWMFLTQNNKIKLRMEFLFFLWRRWGHKNRKQVVH